MNKVTQDINVAKKLFSNLFSNLFLNVNSNNWSHSMVILIFCKLCTGSGFPKEHRTPECLVLLDFSFQMSVAALGCRKWKWQVRAAKQRHFLVHRVNALNYSITTTESKQSSVATRNSSARSKTQRGLKKVLQDDLHFVAKQQRQHIAAANFSETQRRLEVLENCSNN